MAKSTKKSKTVARKKRPSALTRAIESVAAAIRDASATDTFKTPQDTSQAEVVEHDILANVGLHDELTDEQEREAARRWAMGALDYREGQLKKFNGKTETMAEAVQYQQREFKLFEAEIEAGQGWHQNDGDPARYREEMAVPTDAGIRMELRKAMTDLRYAQQRVELLKGEQAMLAARTAQERTADGNPGPQDKADVPS